MNFAAVVRTMTSAGSAEQRVSKYDWQALSQELSNYSCAVMDGPPSQNRKKSQRLPNDGYTRRSFRFCLPAPM
jgi:hypothetical protein